MKKKTPKKTQKKKSPTVAPAITPPKQTKPKKWKGRPIDPGLTLRSDFACIAIQEYEEWCLVSPDGNVHSDPKISGKIPLIRSLPDPEQVAAMCGNRWAWHHLSKFSDNQTAPTLSSIYKRIRKHLKAKIWLPDSRAYSIVTLWIIHTYLHPLFPAVPYLAPVGPQASGKSTLQDVLAAFVFNPVKATDDINASRLLRLIGVMPSTLLLDEFESLKEDARAPLNSGYQASGARYTRNVGHSGWINYNAFGPKAIGGINLPNPTLFSRCILISMLPRPKDISMSTEKELDELAIENVRGDLYAWTLLHHKKVARKIKTIKIPDSLANRDREKYLPLLVLASLVDQDGSLGLVDRVLAYANKNPSENHQGNDLHFYAHQYLKKWLAFSDKVEFKLTELFTNVKDPIPGKIKIGDLEAMLRIQFGLIRLQKPSGVCYQITKADLKRISQMLGLEGT